jgi:hypothetical protein
MIDYLTGLSTRTLTTILLIGLASLVTGLVLFVLKDTGAISFHRGVTSGILIGHSGGLE